MLLLELTNTTHLFHKSPVVSAPKAPIARLPSAASKNTGEKAISKDNGSEKGGPSDKNGQIPSSVSTDPSKWVTSDSGVIVVKQPAVGSTINSGATITGTASVGNVQYRLIDDQVGVISEGPINVVSGNFTAAISFTPHSSTGRLDVFSTEPSGKEINEVQLAVKF